MKTFRQLNEELHKEAAGAYLDGIRETLHAGEVTKEGVQIICGVVTAHLDSLKQRAGVVAR